MKNVKVGLMGCGNISDIYFSNVKKFGHMEIVACADIVYEKAVQKAKQYSIPKACSVKELLADKEIEIILNLTIPLAHAEINLAVLEAGKSVYSEKPLAVSPDEGIRIIDTARRKSLRVGCAPDTFLGGRIQTCIKLVDDGWIGQPVAATAFMACHGHESWHPGPEFYYKKGAGPLFDMGPYYLTALISMLGPVKRVSGSAKTSIPQRLITSEPLYGKSIDVEVPTHISGSLEFENGTICSIITSFDIWDSHLPRIEVYGTEGTLSIMDADPLAGPNLFGGPVYFRNKGNIDWNAFPSRLPRKEQASLWNEIPVIFGYNEDSRGIGLADMAAAICTGRKHRAHGDMAYHVLEVMHGILDSSACGKYYNMKSCCERPAPMIFDKEEF